MTVRMLTIETLVPETVIRQEDVTRLFAEQPEMTRLGSRLVRSAFGGAGVATRHTVLPELGVAAASAPPPDSVAAAGAERSTADDGARPPRRPTHRPAASAEGDAAPSPFVDPVTGHGTETDPPGEQDMISGEYHERWAEVGVGRHESHEGEQ